MSDEGPLAVLPSAANPQDDAVVSSVRRLLALDIGGVLFTDPMPGFFDWVAAQAAASSQEVRDRHGSVRNRLWSGRISVADYWGALRKVERVECTDAELAEQLLGRIRPLAALECLAGWHDRVRVALLSNHRHEWIEPLLERYVGSLVDVAFISSRTGLVKPDLAAFAQLSDLTEPSQIFYVDDQQRNVAVAESMGMVAMQADASATWTAHVDRWVDDGPERYEV